MEKKRIYISLPISGNEAAARQKADAIKAKISKAGHIAVNPFEVYAGKNPDYYDHICSDLRAMMECDAIYFDEGWQSSCGCCIEFHVANELKLRHKKDFEFIYRI